MDKISVNDLKKKAQMMVKDGSMPSLDELLDKISDARASYKPKVEKIRDEDEKIQAGADALK